MQSWPTQSPRVGSAIEDDLRRARRNLLVSIVVLIMFSVAMVGFGVSFFVDSWRSLPASYKTLRTRGVRATARLDKCAPGIGGGRGVGCRLTLHFRGHAKTWDYPINSPQFTNLAVGASVPVLVDPRNPNLVYTVNDVRHNVNTGGFGLIGLVFFALAVVPWAVMFWWRRRLG